MALRSLDTINAISYCAGGLGLDFGIELAMPSVRTVCYLEREAFAAARVVAAIEEGLVAPAPVWSDAKTFNGRPWRGGVDLVHGGVPCQPHSNAGKRLAEKDPRDLWPAFRRGVVQSGAWAVLIENVDGMVSSGGLERVWRDLLRMGAKIEAGLFRADESGAPHERSRIFILAVFEDRFMAHAGHAGLQGRRSDGNRSGQCEAAERGCGALADASRERSDGARQARGLEHPDCGVKLGDAAGDGRRSRRPQSAGQQRVEAASGSSASLANAHELELRGKPSTRQQLFVQQDDGFGGVSGRCDGVMVNAVSGGHRWRPESPKRGPFIRAFDEWASSGTLFPPGPGELARWADILGRSPGLKPAIRRADYGLVSRVDELRMLGNGVVPIQAGMAFRTLVTRLAPRSAAASELVQRLGMI